MGHVYKIVFVKRIEEFVNADNGYDCLNQAEILKSDKHKDFEIDEFYIVNSKDIKIDLCKTCLLDFATCEGKNNVFGCDDGGLSTDDNVTKCDSYIIKNKGWECLSCGYDGADNRELDTFCTKCKKHK